MSIYLYTYEDPEYTVKAKKRDTPESTVMTFRPNPQLQLRLLPLPRPLPQHMFQHLPRPRLRQLLHNHHPLRARKPREALRAERLELLLKVRAAVRGLERRVRVQDHECHGALTPFRVWARDDGYFEYVWVLGEFLFD